MDLFANHLNHQLPLCFCCTSNTLAVASNDLSQPWPGLSIYTFPPIPLLKQTLVKIREDQADKVIIIVSIRTSLKHILDILQSKSETLAVSIIK